MTENGSAGDPKAEDATDGGAVAPLLATSGVQTAAALTMFGVAVVAPAAAPDIGVDAAWIGAFTAIAYGCAMLAGLLTGAFVNRYGAVRIAQGVMLLAAAGMACLALAHPLAALACAVLLGISYGPVNPLSTHILARVVPPALQPLYFSIKQSAQPAGTALAAVLLPFLIELADWQVAVLAAGGIACLVAASVQPLRSRLDATRDRGRRIRVTNLITPLQVIWREPRLRCLALSGFVYSGSQVALASFFVIYLTATLQMSLTQAGAMLFAMQIGGVCGRLFWGAMADRLIPSALILAALGVATACCAVVAGLFTPGWPVPLIGAVSVALGATSHGWNGIFFSELVKFAPPDRLGDAASGAQFSTVTGVAVVPFLFGLVVTAGGGYQIAFFAVAAAMVGASTYLRLVLRRI